MAVRRPPRAASGAGHVLHGEVRPHPGRRHPREGRRGARVPQRLPPSRLPGRRGRGQARDAPVPLPRLDVRARRVAAHGSALGRGAELPEGRARPLPHRGRHLGALRVREHAARSGAALRGARVDAGSGRRARPRRRHASLLHALGDRARRELEDRLRELPRVLPLPGRAPAALADDRRVGRVVCALDRRQALEPARPDPGGRRHANAPRR